MTKLSDLAHLLRSQPTIVASADLSDGAKVALRELGSLRLIGWSDGLWFATREQLEAALESAEILLAGYEPISADLMDRAPRLRLIASIRAAPQANIDVTAATQRGIPVLHTVGRTDHAVAEFTVALILMMTRRMIPATAWMRNRPSDFQAGNPIYRDTVWGKAPHSPQINFTGIELAGRTLGIIGLGSIGRVVIQKMRGFDMKVLVTDPHIDASLIRAEGALPVSMEELLRSADIVSLHARLTPESRGLIGSKEFAMMKAGAYLVNTARAGLIDRTSLERALATEQLAGVALDVFDEEPPLPDDPLVVHPRVVATPHLAAWTLELTEHHSESLLAELKRIAAGGRPQQVVNPEVFTQETPIGFGGNA